MTSPAAVARAPAAAATAELDRTGLCVTGAERLPVGWADEDVIYPLYETSIAHSFWRAQEFSLLRRYSKYLSGPVLDFGCGDGSFAAVLFDRIDYGVDIDPEALAIARQYGIYGELVHAAAEYIPLEPASVGSVFSNSVLEHVSNLDKVIAEIARVTRPGGAFLFCVPLRQFARDLQYWFGATESRQVNDDYYHRNLLEPEDWTQLLARHGFGVEVLTQYQPSEFTYSYWMYRLYGNRALGRLFPGIRERVWRKHSRRLVDRVRESIGGGVRAGGNAFFVARRKADTGQA